MSTGWFALLLFWIFLVSTSHGADTIKQGESLSDRETLVSSTSRFALGFFNPPSSKNRYLGIWFKQPTVQAVAWIANRENYLTGNSSTLAINDDGNLVIHDGGGKSIMVTSFPASPTNSSRATLLDNGNFVLKNEAGEVVWQSFDYPTDTLLIGMKIGTNLKLGHNWSLASWRSPHDPAPGSYSLEANAEGPLQFVIKQKGRIYWSSGTWNGKIWSLLPEMARGYSTNSSDVVSNEDERSNSIIYSFPNTDSGTPMRLVLDSSGQFQLLRWLEDRREWSLEWAQPRDECEEYNTCGPNARCSISPSVGCTCLPGFFSTTAVAGRSNRSSAGCSRKTNLTCGNKDGFYPLDNIKFPDQSIYEPYPNLGTEYCESRCRRNCSCTAYASAYRNGTGGCLFWKGDLMALRDSPIFINADGFDTGNLYIRLSRTDMGANINGSKKKRRQIGVSIGAVAFAVVVCCFICYLLRKKVKRKGDSLLIRTELANS
ncbi:hypothetical protein ACLOJK_039696 [Asimina triloba]